MVEKKKKKKRRSNNRDHCSPESAVMRSPFVSLEEASDVWTAAGVGSHHTQLQLIHPSGWDSEIRKSHLLESRRLLFLREFLHRCSVTRRQSACGSAEVLRNLQVAVMASMLVLVCLNVLLSFSVRFMFVFWPISHSDDMGTKAAFHCFSTTRYPPTQLSEHMLGYSSFSSNWLFTLPVEKKQQQQKNWYYLLLKFLFSLHWMDFFSAL